VRSWRCLLYWRKLLVRSDLLLKLAVRFADRHHQTALQTGQESLRFLGGQHISIVGGIAFFVMSLSEGTQTDGPYVGDVSYRTAFTIGLVQCVSMIPACPAPAQPSSADCCAA
jgi:hypothetical protein